ncbi:MAG: Gfo/Idh/MocA family oxidoreductase [Microbacterium sp.]
MSSLRWGILATGGIAHSMMHDLKLAGLDVRAVGSRSQESADRFAAAFDIPRAHASYEALANDDDIDVVYVASPHGLHFEHTSLVLNAGKHALVEKAFTINQAEADGLRRLAAEKNLLVTEAMWTRHLPHMIRIRDLVRQGALGEVRGLTATHTQSLPTDPAHRLNALALGGGALLDLGIYPISFAWDMLGAPATIQASARLGATGADTEVATVFAHADGAVSTTLSSMRAAGANTAQVLGTEARIDIDGIWFAPTSFRVTATDGTVVEEFPLEHSELRGMQFEALAVEKAIAQGLTSTPEMPIDETVAIMGALDEIRRQIGVRYAQDEASA